MKASPLESKITDIVRPSVEDMGFRLVWVRVDGSNVQITAEDPETRRLGVDDCARLSRAISALLDVEDPVEGRYMLEVSSPGIDRMLYCEQDYIDFAGFEAKIELEIPMDGQKRYRGTIREVIDGAVLLESENKEFRLPVNAVRKAKLVLTDELIAATNTKEKNTSSEER